MEKEKRRKVRIRGKTKEKLELLKKIKEAEAKLPKGIQYILTDVVFGELLVKKSANAWWTNREKVVLLIDAFKMDATIPEARAKAGISNDQFDYFLLKHPEFSQVQEICSQLPVLAARKTVVDEISKNPELAMKYLERKRRKEFSTQTNAIIGEDKKNPFGANWVEAVKLLEKNSKAVRDIQPDTKDVPKLKDY